MELCHLSNIPIVIMTSRTEISKDLRKLVVEHRNNKKSFGEISKLLNLSKSTVHTIFNNFKQSSCFESKPRSGRPKKLNRREVSFIRNEVEKNPKIHATSLAQELAERSQIVVHPRTITRALNNEGYRCRIPRKKPLISEKNRKLRLEFANKHRDKGLEFWKLVLFTDESKYNVFGYDGKAKVWRKPNTALQPKNIVSTVKHGGGSVMVWGAIAASGVGNLVFVEGNMDRLQYKRILEHNLQPSVDKLNLGASWIFQQDNDPKHTAKIVKDWLLYYAPRQLHSPPQSPDLNIIEHVWEILDRKIRKHAITSAELLKEKLMEEWQNISVEELENLAASMPRRLQAVIDANGGPTKY